MTTPDRVRRGGIYLVDLGTSVCETVVSAPGGSKKRPALVVQNDLGNLASDTTIVVALSSKVPSRKYPFHVDLPAEILGKPGIVMCEQIYTVGLGRVDRQALAECPPQLMDLVDDALRHSLGLSEETGRGRLSS